MGMLEYIFYLRTRACVFIIIVLEADMFFLHHINYLWLWVFWSLLPFLLTLAGLSLSTRNMPYPLALLINQFEFSKLSDIESAAALNTTILL